MNLSPRPAADGGTRRIVESVRNWPALFLLIIGPSILLTFSCGRRQLSPSHPPVTYNENAGTVFIPNATIITGGTEYSESAPLPDTGLALVITEDSSLYFYSARLGDLDSVGLEHSCKAIGYFLLANLGQNGPSPADLDVELESGIKLRTVPGNRVECANTLHRWAAVRVNPTDSSVLLTPRSFFKIGLVDLFEGDMDNVFQFNRAPRDTVTTGTLYETYGGVARMALCTFTVPLLTRQGDAIKAGFSSDPVAFSCLQVLDGCDIIWLIVEAISPVGAGTIFQAMQKSVFKTLVRTSVQDVLSDAVAQGSSRQVGEVALRGLMDALVEAVIRGIGGQTICSEADDSKGLPMSNPGTPPQRSEIRSAELMGSECRAAVEPVTVCLTILKAIKLLVAGVDFGWGVYDAATHDAYAQCVDSAGGQYPDQVVATIPVGGQPTGVAALPAGDYVYVASQVSDSVSVIRTQDNTVVATIPVGSRPWGVAALPNGDYIYVANEVSDNVTVIRTQDNTVVATVPTGDYSTGVTVLPSGNAVYVTNAYSNDVSVVRTQDNTVVATIPVGNGPAGVAALPNSNYVYVANQVSDSVSVIRTQGNAVVATIPVGDQPSGVVSLPDGSYIYVANYLSDNVSVIRTQDNTVVATIPIAGGPNCVAALPNGSYVYVTNSDSASVSVIRTQDNTVVATIPVGDAPGGVAVLPDGNHVYVSNWNGNSISVIGY